MTLLNTHSLKFRITAAVVVLVLAAASLVALAALAMAKREMRSVLGDQQFAILKSAAAYIEADLGSRRALLSSLREDLAAANVRSGDGMQEFIEAHASLRDEFFNVLVYDTEGMIIANLNDRRVVRTQDFSQRQYFIDTVRFREGVISKPFRSLLSGKPVVLVTEPVFARDGTLLFILAGAIDLQQPRFFGQLESLKIGQSGYLFMLTDTGTIVHHPDRRRILDNVRATPGMAEPAMLAALAGAEGWSEGETRDGVPALLTYKRLPQTGWVIGAVYPLAEAMTPLIGMQRKALIASGLVAALAGLAAWLVALRLLRPLGALRDHVAGIERGSHNIEVLDVARRDEFGELSRAFYQLSRQRRDAERDLAALARTDALTGIANRRMFEEVFALALGRSARTRTALGLAYLDIDHFKAINDSRGHGAGDAVLVEFARRLQQAVRSTDTVARLAGDEFVVLFECMGDDTMPETLANKIFAMVRPSFAVDGGPISVTTSIGIALASNGMATMNGMLDAADEALYEAKHQGRDSFAVRRLQAQAAA